MSENMLGGALREACGPLKDLMEKLSGKDGLWWLAAFKKFLRKENPFKDSQTVKEAKLKWKKFYAHHFQRYFDFSKVLIPEKPEGDDWTLLVIADVKIEEVCMRCKLLFPCEIWMGNEYVPSLERRSPFNPRGTMHVLNSQRDPANGAYAIWVRNAKESESELHESPVEFLSKSPAVQTLHERLIQELNYFDEFGEHLDSERTSICLGSRCPRGTLLTVAWKQDHLIISTAEMHTPGGKYYVEEKTITTGKLLYKVSLMFCASPKRLAFFYC